MHSRILISLMNESLGKKSEPIICMKWIAFDFQKEPHDFDRILVNID